ncbi:MAG: hypothetical protein HYY50_01380 [Candidatus Kerfeldbacteria bacterium]|nr:hypothetical protein [Candidatus Kerfeldbacteria bacterium]
MPEPTNPFAQLPSLMQQVLNHEENIDVNMAIEQSNGLTAKQGDQMMGVIRKIILKVMKPAELVATIKQDIVLDDDRAKKLALDLLGRRFLPMEWYIGKVQPLIHELGGNVAEYLAEVKKLYPEVYAPAQAPTTVPSPTDTEHPLLRDFDQRVSSLKGKGEILLRLTGLSSQVEEAVKAEQLEPDAGERMMQELDAMSYAVNTQDLNPFEINSLKRKLRRILSQLSATAPPG